MERKQSMRQGCHPVVKISNYSVSIPARRRWGWVGRVTTAPGQHTSRFISVPNTLLMITSRPMPG